MGQSEVYNYLEKVNDWKTSAQIAKAIKVRGSGLSRTLNQMLKYNELKMRQVKIRVGKCKGLRLVSLWKAL